MKVRYNQKIRKYYAECAGSRYKDAVSGRFTALLHRASEPVSEKSVQRNNQARRSATKRFSTRGRLENFGAL